MHTIKIDDEVMAYLQARAKPFVDNPNDVLRRELLGSGSASATTSLSTPTRRPGALKQYIDKGIIEPGPHLIYVQPRKRREFRGEITEDGWIVAGGESFEDASPSLRHMTGTSINGWLWVYEPTGKTLNKQTGRK